MTRLQETYMISPDSGMFFNELSPELVSAPVKHYPALCARLSDRVRQ